MEEFSLEDLPTNEAVPKLKLKRFAPIKLFDTGSLSNDEFSKIRQEIEKALGHKVLGGSDTGKALGISKFVSPQELYDQKAGLKPEIQLENPDKKWIFTAGHAFEDGVAQLTKLFWEEKKHAVSIINDTNMYQCATKDEKGLLRYPFAVGNLDRIIIIDGKKGVLELKTTSRLGEIPKEYILQCRYYMAITNLDFAIISICAGNSKSSFKSVLIRRDMELEESLMESMRDFWLLIEEGGERKIKGANASLMLSYLNKYYGDIDETLPIVDMSSKRDEISEVLKIDEKIKNLETEIKSLKERKTELYAEWTSIYKKSAEAVVETAEGIRVLVKRTPGYFSEEIDEERLRKEEPETYKRYLTLFNKSLFKAEEPEKYKDYLKPKMVNPESKKEAFSLKVLGKKGGNS